MLQIFLAERLSLDPLNEVVEKQLPAVSVVPAFSGFAVQCRKNFPPSISAAEQMRSPDQEIVSNQTRDVGGMTGVAEFLPAEVCVGARRRQEI